MNLDLIIGLIALIVLLDIIKYIKKYPPSDTGRLLILVILFGETAVYRFLVISIIALKSLGVKGWFCDGRKFANKSQK